MATSCDLGKQETISSRIASKKAREVITKTKHEYFGENGVRSCCDILHHANCRVCSFDLRLCFSLSSFSQDRCPNQIHLAFRTRLRYAAFGRTMKLRRRIGETVINLIEIPFTRWSNFRSPTNFGSISKKQVECGELIGQGARNSVHSDLNTESKKHIFGE